jgi:hypothetical protein
LSLKESRHSKWLDARERANTEVLRFPPNVPLLFVSSQPLREPTRSS